MNSRPTFQVGERGASPVLLEGTGRSSSSRPMRVDSHAVHEQLRGGRAPLLTVIVPVYNEAATIDRLLALVLQAPYLKQIIVVDDASSDNSAVLLRKWAQSGDIELLLHARNQGKGAAIRTALACEVRWKRYARFGTEGHETVLDELSMADPLCFLTSRCTDG